MALTVRERFDGGRSVGIVGTYRRPLPIDTRLTSSEPTSQVFQIRLGFDGIPSTQFFSLPLEQRCSIRCLRRGRDPYLVHVAVNLLGPGDERSGRPLVQTVDGDSGWIDLPAGDWRISVAVGIAIEIELELEILLAPTPVSMEAIITPQLKAPPRHGPGGGIIWADTEPPISTERPALHRPGPRSRMQMPPTAIDSSVNGAAPPRHRALLQPAGTVEVSIKRQPFTAEMPLPRPDAGSRIDARALHGISCHGHSGESSPTLPVRPWEVRIARGELSIDSFRRSRLIPPGWDLFDLRPWRCGICAGALWLQDRRGLLHTFSTWPVFIAPAPGPLRGPGGMAPLVQLHRAIEPLMDPRNHRFPEVSAEDGNSLWMPLRPDAAARGILQCRAASLPAKDITPFQVSWEGTTFLRGLWHRLEWPERKD